MESCRAFYCHGRPAYRITYHHPDPDRDSDLHPHSLSDLDIKQDAGSNWNTYRHAHSATHFNSDCHTHPKTCHRYTMR